MGGSSVDGSSSSKRHGGGKRKSKHLGGSRSKKMKYQKTPIANVDSGSESDGNGSDAVEGEEYIVENILDKRRENGVWMYYIKWLGYSSSANTWEPVENLRCDELLKQFEDEWSAKEKRHERGSSEETVRIRGVSNDSVVKGEKKKGAATAAKCKREGSLTPSVASSKNEDKVDKKKSTNSSRARSVSVEKEKEKSDSGKKKNYEELEVLDVCPEGRIPKKLIGVVPISEDLVYCVEWAPPEEHEEHFEPISLVRNNVFSEAYPEIVIKFYENHIIWSKDPKDAAAKKSTTNTESVQSSKKSKGLASNNSRGGASDDGDESDDQPLIAKRAGKKYDDDSDSHSKENYP